MYTVNIAGKECAIYAEVLDHKAMADFRSAMECDFAIAGALMADAHVGKALPIGSVVASEDVIVPAWVGSDIGCGMTAFKLNGETHLLSEYRELIKKWFYDKGLINGQRKELFREINDWILSKVSDITKERIKHYGGVYNFGTLGGGNHFAEIGKEDNGQYWLTVHSGSRDLGRIIGDKYMRLAADEHGSNRIEGHFGFHQNSYFGKRYIQDMNTALTFALKSRLAIVDRIILEVNKCLNHILKTKDTEYVTSEVVVNRNHNHAELRIVGRPLWIHRKGATQADAGMLGVIPGNMKDGVFIVEGKGDLNSIFSSSHGAGRVMSRGEAKDVIDLEKFEKDMIEAGISAKVSTATLDEAPEAYKNIFDVMEAQEDLVEIKHYIKPVINLKG